MNINHLEIFIDLAETLSFRKTAYRKNVSQPAVSQAIISVENEIGVKLFSRSRSGVKLLSNGQLLYEDIKPLLNTYYKSIQKVRQIEEKKDSLTIGMTASPNEATFIPSILPKFCQLYPGIKIFLQNYDHTHLKHQLINRDCDVILITKDDINEKKNIAYVEALTGRFNAVVPVTSPLVKMETIAISDLEKQSIIFLDNNWCPPEQLRLQEIIRHEVLLKDISYVNNVNTANIMCESGLGITVCPDFICGSANQFIKPIPIDYKFKLSYGVAFLKDNTNKPISLFTSFFKKQFKQ